MTRTGPRHAWVDGRLVNVAEAQVSAFDRGFVLGDGVFETLRARAGRVTELAAHLARLHRSADGLAIPLATAADIAISTGIETLLAAEDLAGLDDDAAIRITVSRGAYLGRGLLPPEESPPPTVVIQVWPVAPPPAGHLERGLHLVPSRVRRDPTSPLAALKTTSRADYVYARLEARQEGADDALFLTIDGRLSEATSANLFLIHDRRLQTPSLDSAILPGTTRDWILDWGRNVGLDVGEMTLTPEDLHAADEAFLSSSVAGILPVTRYDRQPIGAGRPGPWFQRARADREAFIRGEPS
jgi:branched-chain amino acid aminotransferase